jgi:heme/copper-type cytochrome/quinol oxidase subunit 2
MIAFPVLAPAGPEAASIARYWWLSFWVSLVVLVTVTTVMLYAVLRRRATGVPLPLVPGRERWTAVAVASATALTVVTLLVLLIASILTGYALDDHARADGEPTAASGRQP